MGPMYVDPVAIRDAEWNRRENCARGLPSVMPTKAAPYPGFRTAIVGFGPSLQETWQLLDTGEYDIIWTVSKAHDFLIQRGLLPTRHTDTDFRQHKALFNASFRPGVQYIMASQVHPAYLGALDDMRISLFHVDQPNGGFFPPGYLRVPAMYDAGLQAALLAFKLGYRDQEWFGFDASFRGDQTHAGEHGGHVHDRVELEVAGEPRIFSNLTIRAALCAEKLLCKHPQLKVKIHGDGALRPLLQERGKCSVS
jgi:hypothetical protein